MQASSAQLHYTDVIMTTMASQITSLTVVYSIDHSGADQRKYQSSASVAFVWGIHQDRWIPAQRANNAKNVSIWWRHPKSKTVMYFVHYKIYYDFALFCLSSIIISSNFVLSIHTQPIFHQLCLIKTLHPTYALITNMMIIICNFNFCKQVLHSIHGLNVSIATGGESSRYRYSFVSMLVTCIYSKTYKLGNQYVT